MNFNELPLKETILRAIEERGFTEPTEIQEKAISLLAEKDCDFVGQAQTGTGKTAAFSIPLLQKIDLSSNKIQGIILSPTRELANQICEEIKKLSVYEKAKTLSVYGGVSIENQLRSLKRLKPQIIVGTPGRVLDLIRRGALKLEDAQYAILDEADEMLDMGFLDDVKEILSELEEGHRTWMLSATMPPAILNLIKNYLSDPEIVKIKKKTLSNENITQKFFVVRESNMREATCRLLDSIEEYYGIIFTKTKIEAKNLTDELNLRGYLADSLHGDMDQRHRDVTMRRFKDKKVKLLVCTDVAARGIDVDNLTHVINFGLPQDLEAYVHRIGRTGRAGQKGEALSIVSPSEQRRLRPLENLTKAKIERAKMPDVRALKDAMVKRTVNQFETIFEMLEEQDKMDDSFEFFSNEFEHLDKDQVLKVMFTQLFSDQMKRLDREPEIDVKPRERRDRDDAPVGVPNKYGDIRFFMNAGREDGVDLRGLIDTIAAELRIEARKIRNVQLKDKFSFLEVPAKHKDDLLGGVQIVVGNKKVRFEPTRENRSGGGRGGSRGGNFRGGNRRGGSFRDSRGGGRSGNFRGGNRGNSRGNSRGGSRGGNGNSEPNYNY